MSHLHRYAAYNRIADPDTIELWEHSGMLYLNVTVDSATVVHEEHKPLTPLRGTYLSRLDAARIFS